MNRSFADVVGAVVVFATGVLVLAWAAGLFRGDTVVEPEPVDYLAIAAEAELDAGFALAAPAELPAGWRATSARWEQSDRLWHLGMLTADEEYVEVEQSDAPPWWRRPTRRTRPSRGASTSTGRPGGGW